MTDEEKIVYILKSMLHQSTLPNDGALRHIARTIRASMGCPYDCDTCREDEND